MRKSGFFSSCSRFFSLLLWVFFGLSFGLTDPPAYGGSLASVTPMGASSQVTIYITGTGFNTTASNNEVTFTPVSGTSAISTGISITTLNSTTGLRRLSVKAPGGLPVGTTVLQVRNKVTGEVSTGKSIEVIEISLSDVTSAPPGATNLNVRITGSPNTQFVAGKTRAVFGTGVTVNAATVESATRLVANISVSPTATLGSRTVGVITSTQTALRTDGFTVSALPPPNSPPVFAPISNPIVDEGTALDVAISATDPEGDPITLAASSLPVFAHFTDLGGGRGTLSLAPDFTQAGTYLVTFSVSDGMASAEQVVSITVVDVNRPPGFTSSPVTEAVEGASYTYPLTVEDPDRDPLTYSLTQAPEGMTIDPASGLISWTPSGNHVGLHEVTVQVSDGKGGTAAQDYLLIVTAAVDRTPPVVGLVAPSRVQVSGAVNVEAQATDNVGVKGVSFYVDDLHVKDGSAEPYQLTYNAPDQPGVSLRIRAVAFDEAGNEGEATATIRVEEGPDTTPPVIGYIHLPSTAAPGDQVSVQAGVTDDRGVAEVRFSRPGQVIGTDFTPPYEGLLSIPLDALVQDPFAVDVEAVDTSGNTAMGQGSLTVGAATDITAPTAVTLQAPAEAFAGQMISLGASAVDDVGILKVVFYADRVRIAEDASPPYESDYRIPESQPAGSQVVFLARAVDFSENGRDSSPTATRVVARGEGFIVGEVYDDTTGLPVSGVTVMAVTAGGKPLPQPLEMVADGRGRYRVLLTEGRAALELRKEGYTSSYREIDVLPGTVVYPLDTRTTPLGNGYPVRNITGGNIAIDNNRIHLYAPPGAFGMDITVTLTPLSGQGLPAPLPLGWNPVSVVHVGPEDKNPNVPLELTIRGEFTGSGSSGAEGMIGARWDAKDHRWLRIETTPLSGESGFIVRIPFTGTVALVRPDTQPAAPPVPGIEAALSGVAPLSIPDDVTAAIYPSPKVLFMQPGARSSVSVEVRPLQPLPSGAPIQVDFSEIYNRTDGTRLNPEPMVQDFILYQNQNATTMGSRFVAGPSEVFEPALLQEGTITLSAHRPEGADGQGIIGSAGGTITSPEGLTLSLPAGAVTAPTPVDLSTFAVTDTDLAGNPRFSVLAGVEIGFGGALLSSSAILSMPLPEGVAPDAQVLAVRPVEVEGVTRHELVGVATINGNTLSLGGNEAGLPFPGILEGGRYLFLGMTEPVGFVTGAMQSGDAPVANGMVGSNGLPFISLTDIAGPFYVLASPLGTFGITGKDLADGSVATGTVTLHSKGEIATLALSVTASLPTVVSVIPVDGAVKVPLVTVVIVSFSEAVDPASVTQTSVLLSEGGVPVSGAVSLSIDRRTLTFRPDAFLKDQATYQLTVASAIRDLHGNPMGSPFVSHFTTVDLTPPPPPPAGSITATIPGPAGTTTISGSQGTADPGGTVVVHNVTTGTLTTVIPNADGSFTATPVASPADKVELIIQDAAGNQTYVVLGPFRNPDGSVVVGEAGGRVEGPGGVAVDIPPGALPEGTVVKIDPVGAEAFGLPVPADAPLVGGVHLSLGGVTPNAPLDLAFPAPPDATPQNQVFVARVVQSGKRQGWTLMDRAHLGNGKYATASPPFPGANAEGSYAFLQSTLGCVSYVTVQYSFSAEFVFVPIFSIPFIFPVTDAGIFTTPAVCDSTFDIQMVDPNTDQVIQQITQYAPAAPDEIFTSPDIVTDDETPPMIVETNTFSGYQTTQIEIRFSEPVRAESMLGGLNVEGDEHMIVLDGEGNPVEGRVELREGNRLAVFYPHSPFQLGVRHTVLFFGVTDLAGNVLEAPELVFTPFEAQPVSVIANDAVSALGETIDVDGLLKKCAGPDSCSTSVPDVAFIGNTLFIANGLRGNEQYLDPADPKRLIAVDVTDAKAPRVIGVHSTTTNPRVLAAVSNVALPLPAGGQFTGDLLVVVGGGRVPGGELAGKLEVYDVTACTHASVVGNCLDGALKGHKLLSTPVGLPPPPGVPAESGVPLQVAVMAPRGLEGAAATAAAAYVVVAPVAVEAVDLAETFNNPITPTSDVAPDGLVYGDFLDVATLKSRVLTIGVPGGFAQAGGYRLQVYSAQLTLVDELDAADGLPGTIARVATAENMVFDIDQDGNLGVAEDEDNPQEINGGLPLVLAGEELFDIAITASGPLTEGCAEGQTPCGRLDVLDLSSATNLAHAGIPRILSRIPLPGPAFSLQIDPVAKLAYVEIRGHGLAVVDLSHLIDVLKLQGTSPIVGLVDVNQDGRDDRVLDVFPMGQLIGAEIKVDFDRGIAYVNNAASGPQIVQVANRCRELSLDFNQGPSEAVEEGDRAALLIREKEMLKRLVDDAVQQLRTAIVSLNAPDKLSLIEQGSGSCFWRDGFEEDSDRTCSAFQVGTSDHDIEVFVPAADVSQAQGVLDDVLKAMKKNPNSDFHRLGDLALFAMPKEAFEAAELLVGTPMNTEGDTSGDLAMGRQTLLLLWLLEGEYIDGYEGRDAGGVIVTLRSILEKLQKKPEEAPVIPDEPSGIPRLEGYEWTLLQEYNFYKTGAMLRTKGGCDDPNQIRTIPPRLFSEVGTNDPNRNFNEESFLVANCQDELHTVAKAAIRTVLAQLIAHPLANPVILQGRWVADADGTPLLDGNQNPILLPLDRDAYRRNFCVTGVSDPYHPPSDPNAYYPKPCGSFEEFIVSVAVESVKRDLGVFQPIQLPMIFRFYCIKVDCAKNGPIVQNDDDANQFVAEAITFIDLAQTLAKPTYDGEIEGTIQKDLKLIDPIPFFEQGPPGHPGIEKICNDLGFPVPVDLNGKILRRDLRNCNREIVNQKVNGIPAIQIPQEVQEKHIHVGLDKEDANDLKKKLGVKHYAQKELQVRALNRSPHPIPKVTLRMYEGDGVDQANYQEKKEADLSLERGARMVNLQADTPGTVEPIFSALFNLTRPELTPNTPRALSFFLDPNRRIPEDNKQDNHAGYFYFVLNPDSLSGPSTPPDPVVPIENLDPDPLCLETPFLEFDLTVQGTGTTGVTPDLTIGTSEAAVSVYKEVLLTYRVKNLGKQPIKEIVVFNKSGEAVIQIPILNPGQSHTQTEPFTPTQARRYNILASASGKDEKGNVVGPVIDSVILNATADLQPFEIQLFDDSRLATPGQNPFGIRRDVHLDITGQDIPILGAVTDGNDDGSGGRIRIRIERLEPNVETTVAITDGELTNVTDGIGRLEFKKPDGTIQYSAGGEGELLISGLPPDSSGTLTVYYTPPPVFVREAHRAADSNWPAAYYKKERRVKFMARQDGQSVRTILLRRPPVFLVHGLFGNRETWELFRPLVPKEGFGPGPIKGFDGRFDVFVLDYPAFRKLAEEANAIKYQIGGALAEYLPGFSIGKIDVAAHSMGGVLIRRLAKDFSGISPTVPVPPDPKNLPFRKLITLDTPFTGTLFANTIVDIRKKLPVKVDLMVDLINPAPDAPTIDPTLDIKVKLEMCALAVHGAGLLGKSLFGGAIDDLQVGSPELAGLGGILVPSHHVAGITENGQLGVDLQIEGLWTTLGLACNLTPDTSTIEKTILIQVGIEAIKTVIPILKATRLAKSADRVKELLDVQEKVVQYGHKKLIEGDPPKPVFKIDGSDQVVSNDRIVPESSQADGIPLSDPAYSSAGAETSQAGTDHLKIKESPGIIPEACIDGSDPIGGPKIRFAITDYDIDFNQTPDVVCRVIHLLEKDANTPNFKGPEFP